MRAASLSRFVITPETRPAILAVRRLARNVMDGRPATSADPLYLYGPPGTGKSHLAQGLLAEVSGAQRTARLILAAEIVPNPDGPPEALDGTETCDVLILEDLQHLQPSVAESLARILDHRSSHRRPTLLTASVGPARLTELPQRLTSRLSGGLVIGLEPFGPPSRRYVLHRIANARKLVAGEGVLDWLAEVTPGGVRPLLGALTTLASLSRGQALPPDLTAVQSHWSGMTADEPPIERIMRHVCRHFGLKPKAMQSRNRQPAALWPVQVAMYLARELTGQPWPQIGAAFGGRDASTVRHAHGKVSERMAEDAATLAEIRRLQSELS